MANVDAPVGFWPIKSLSGDMPTPIEVYVDSSQAVNIGKGAVVTRESDGNVAFGGSSGTYDSTKLAQCVGVVLGCFDSNRKPLKYLPSSTAGYLMVMPVKNVLFGCQSDGSVVQADIGVVRALVYDNSVPCNTTTGNSTTEVSYTTSSNPVVKVLDKVNTPGNDWGTNVNLEVIFLVDGLNSSTGI